MIIGCYNNDGSPAEEVNLQDKGRFFELEVCAVRHPRRYPEYNIDYQSLAFCSSKESAENTMNKILESGDDWLKDIYCWFVYERCLDVPYERTEYMKCWLYDETGQMIDKRLFPSYWSEDGFEGRGPDEVRFKFGDLAELYDGNTVSLVWVLAPPQKREWYIKKTIEHGEPYRGDISDDSYIVIDKPFYTGGHMHIDALALFKPHFAIPKNVMRKFDKIWEGYLEDRRECYGDNPTEGQI